jgi:dTDP-4-dehydrorhamnose reductase
MKILVLGGGGMLGHMMVRVLAASGPLDVAVSVRVPEPEMPKGVQVWTGVDATQPDVLMDLMQACRPDVVVNCVGLVKQRAQAEDPLIALPINTILPHRLSRLCALTGARLIHFSTDCVFSGESGNYRESDIPDARDLYGRSKLLGEVHDTHALTLRVSIIGPELHGAQGLLGWFLSQQRPVRGFRRAVFSGLTTLELACVVRDKLLGRPDLHGLYHLSADPITKFDLLILAGKIYSHSIHVDGCEEPVIDRSLDSTRLRTALDYRPPSWHEMLAHLKADTDHA